MIIPFKQLSDEAVENLIKEYCLRDWGLNEIEAPLEDRMIQVRRALHAEQLVVLYSEHFENARLVSQDELKSFS